MGVPSAIGVFLMIREFLEENHCADKEVGEPVAGKILVKKNEQLKREERTATLVCSHGTIPLESRGMLANNNHLVHLLDYV